MKVLVTAGATWVKVDDVRILTNKFTGKTGLYVAQQLKERGHSVTLLINDHCIEKIKGLKVISYRYFDDFKSVLMRNLAKNRYDAIIHMAAVSDYKVKNVKKGKIPSYQKKLALQLVPTEKLVKIIRRLCRQALLIQFKLEVKRKGLIEDAYQNLKENNSDFVVANALKDLVSGYKGFIVSREKHVIPVNSKVSLANNLCKLITLLSGSK
ncbi:MAG: hypothetical protein JSW17_05340 [Candidatus Omnitrophota bacterium]|nr:MAG: hypothetical protein JSW17_05340 [Candidatus Omnitrophota bacterium]